MVTLSTTFNDFVVKVNGIGAAIEQQMQDLEAAIGQLSTKANNLEATDDQRNKEMDELRADNERLTKEMGDLKEMAKKNIQYKFQ